MKLFLNITLVLITIFACFAENVYLALRPPKSENKIMFTIRARQSFNFDQKKALSSNRMQAFSQYVPVFNYVPAKVAASKKKMEALIKEFLSFRAQKKKRIDDLITITHSEVGVEVSRETLTKMLRYRDLKKLLEGILTIEETILQNKILPGPQHVKGKKTIEIHDPALAAPVITPIAELISLEKARFSMQQKVQQLFWQVNDSILDPVLKICQATLLPNLEYDNKENARRLDRIQRQYPIQTLRFQAGDILVPLRKQLNEQDVLLLNAFQKQQTKEIYHFKRIPSVHPVADLCHALRFFALAGDLIKPWKTCGDRHRCCGNHSGQFNCRTPVPHYALFYLRRTDRRAGIRQYPAALAHNLTFAERGSGQQHQCAGLQLRLASRFFGGP
jgi:hypothetical protein